MIPDEVVEEVRARADIVGVIGEHVQLKKAGKEVAEKLVLLLQLLAEGESLGMPTSRPMPQIALGVHELRIRDAGGNWRVFYFTKTEDLLVIHAFQKKTQKTPKREIDSARARLKEMMS